MTITIERLNTEVFPPRYAFDTGTSGFDLYPFDILKIYNGNHELSHEEIKERYDSVNNNVKLCSAERALFSTRQHFNIPDGYEVQIRPKSGITLKTGIIVQFGTIDSNYQGDCSISVLNSNNEDAYVQIDKALAQGVVVKVERAIFNTTLAEHFYANTTERGHGGFGSTNK